MPFDRHNTFLRWPKLPDDVDWANLKNSHALGVQIQWAAAMKIVRMDNGRPPQTLMDLIVGRGYKVILDLEFSDTYDMGLFQEQAEAIHHLYGPFVYAVRVFNEPDVDEQGKPVDLRTSQDAGHPVDWHQDWARHHADETLMVAQMIGASFNLIGAAMCNRPEREDDYSEPGLQEWWTELRRAYHSARIHGVDVHIYENALNMDPGSVDTITFKQKMRMHGREWQPDLYMGEFNIADTPSNKWSAEDRGHAWVSAIKWMERSKQRWKLFSPFTANGFDNGTYPRYYIVREGIAYEILGSYIGG